MKTIKILLTSLLIIPLVALTLVLFPTSKSNAATMTTAYLTLSRMKASMTGTDNIELYFAFRPSASVGSGGTLVLEFPIAGSVNWCRVAGTDLVVSGVTSTPGDTTGNFDVGAALPTTGTLAAACTVGNGTTTADRITVTNIGALVSTTTYGVKISNGTTGKIGTSTAGQHVVTATVTQGTTIETKSFGVNIVSDDQVVISATVQDVQTVTCTINSNTVALGNLYKGGTYVTGSHTIGTSSTTSASGYYWAAYGRGNGSSGLAGLWKSTATTYLIPSDTGSSTVDISAPASEGFGMTVSQPAGTVVGTGFATGTPGVFGTIGRSAANSKIILYKLSAASGTETSTITYGARAGASAVAGSYSETVTFVCGGYY